LADIAHLEGRESVAWVVEMLHLAVNAGLVAFEGTIAAFEIGVYEEQWVWLSASIQGPGLRY